MGVLGKLRSLVCKHYNADGTSAWRVISVRGSCTLYGCTRCGATKTVCR